MSRSIEGNAGQWSQERCVSRLRKEYPGEDVAFTVIRTEKDPLLMVLRKFFERTKLNDLVDAICGDYEDRSRTVFAFRYVLERLTVSLKISKGQGEYEVAASFAHPAGRFSAMRLPPCVMNPDPLYEKMGEMERARNPQELISELVDRIYDSEEHARHVRGLLARYGECTVTYSDGVVYDT